MDARSSAHNKSALAFNSALRNAQWPNVSESGEAVSGAQPISYVVAPEDFQYRSQVQYQRGNAARDFPPPPPPPSNFDVPPMHAANANANAGLQATANVFPQTNRFHQSSMLAPNAATNRIVAVNPGVPQVPPTANPSANANGVAKNRSTPTSNQMNARVTKSNPLNNAVFTAANGFGDQHAFSSHYKQYSSVMDSLVQAELDRLLRPTVRPGANMSKVRGAPPMAPGRNVSQPWSGAPPGSALSYSPATAHRIIRSEAPVQPVAPSPPRPSGLPSTGWPQPPPPVSVSVLQPNTAPIPVPVPNTLRFVPPMPPMRKSSMQSTPTGNDPSAAYTPPNVTVFPNGSNPNPQNLSNSPHGQLGLTTQRATATGPTGMNTTVKQPHAASVTAAFADIDQMLTGLTSELDKMLDTDTVVRKKK